MSAEVARPLPEEAGLNVTKCVAAVVAATTFTFCAVVAVPVNAPENVVAESISVLGL